MVRGNLKADGKMKKLANSMAIALTLEQTYREMYKAIREKSVETGELQTVEALLDTVKTLEKK